MADNVDELLNCHASSCEEYSSFILSCNMIGQRENKVITSQKSFSGSGSQTLFSAEPVTEKIRLRSQASNASLSFNFNYLLFLLAKVKDEIVCVFSLRPGI